MLTQNRKTHMEYAYTLRSISIYSHTCTHKHTHIQRSSHILSDQTLSFVQQYIPEIEWHNLSHLRTLRDNSRNVVLGIYLLKKFIITFDIS